MEGLEELKDVGIITEFYILKTESIEFDQVNSSSDRVAYFTIQDKDWNHLLMRHRKAEKIIKAVDKYGRDILMRDIVRNI
jgi:hypothetical protein